MPTLRDIFSQVKTIHYTSSHFKVEHTVAGELRSILAPQAEVRLSAQLEAPAGSARIAVVDDSTKWKSIHAALEQKRDWMMLRVKPGSGIELLVSRPHLLYGFFCWIQDEWLSRDAAEFANGKILHPTFSNMRPLYDLFLIQHARTVRNFNREEYFKTLARSGFSHAEVNGLAFAVPIETGPKGEVYPRFYTYCPALDQFVASRLNKGIYADDYLQANLNNLKTNVELAERYGLASGLVCFEPRSVPEQLIQRYPVLRGARVDHPIRSFQPRYNLSIAHPVVREHYAEMMENLIKEVPSLDYISIWSNDSGAGFEYTSSLYVGRNGGGYVIREWKGDKEIAEAAAHNLVRFLRVLRDAGRKVNPKFRSLIRLEPFTAEHDYIWQQLEDGVDVEVSSLQTKGWGLSYKHPKYAEVPEIHGMNVYSRFDPKEKPLMQELQQRGSQTDVVFTPGILWNHEPLIGIPFPYLVYEKLNDMAAQEVKTVCALGGATPLAFAPYNINQELVRALQFSSTSGCGLGWRKSCGRSRQSLASRRRCLAFFPHSGLDLRRMERVVSALRAPDHSQHRGDFGSRSRLLRKIFACDFAQSLPRRFSLRRRLRFAGTLARGAGGEAYRRRSVPRNECRDYVDGTNAWPRHQRSRSSLLDRSLRPSARFALLV